MTKPDPRLSHQTLRVLRIFLEQGNGKVAGSDIVKTLGILSGTLYPILVRLELAGWLESEWEVAQASGLGRPRKRFYSLTALGFRKASQALEEIRLSAGGFAWST